MEPENLGSEQAHTDYAPPPESACAHVGRDGARRRVRPSLGAASAFHAAGAAHAVLLQCMAETMVGRDFAAFARSCTACHDAAAGAVHAAVLNEMARRLKAGKEVGDAISFGSRCLPTSHHHQELRLLLLLALQSIALPASVTTFDRYTFTDCPALDAPGRERIRAICPTPGSSLRKQIDIE